MVRAAVCQPLAASPPKIVSRAAFFVEMEWLGIEFGRESLDLLRVDLQSARTEGLPHREVFEIPLSHFA